MDPVDAHSRSSSPAIGVLNNAPFHSRFHHQQNQNEQIPHQSYFQQMDQQQHHQHQQHQHQQQQQQQQQQHQQQHQYIQQHSLQYLQQQAQQSQKQKEDTQNQDDHPTTYCPHCNLQLVLGVPSALVACPQCLQVFNPQSFSGEQTYGQPYELGNEQQTTACQQLEAICIGCHAQLAYPSTASFIQCPKCNQTMKVPDPTDYLLPHDAENYGNIDIASTGIEGEDMGRLGAVIKESINQKKRKEPGAPKAVVNAYMIFCKMRRGDLKKTNPQMPFGKIGARLGEMWRTMTPEEKKPYEDRAMVDRERYRREMMEFQQFKDGKGPLPPKRAKESIDLYRKFEIEPPLRPEFAAILGVVPSQADAASNAYSDENQADVATAT